MANASLVDARNVVVNRIVVEGTAVETFAAEGITPVLETAGTGQGGIGWTYDPIAGVFVRPPEGWIFDAEAGVFGPRPEAVAP